jgi:tRNA/tmRNA/rRNA uracil-C5-methylase (TrmA/RlmC/RlmD family)
LTVGTILDLTVAAVAHGGHCVARPADEPVVFVRHALPGEQVHAVVTDLTVRVEPLPGGPLGWRRGTDPRIVAGPRPVREHAVGREWTLAATSFWQVHPAAADTLAATVVELLRPRPGERA